MLSTLCWVHSAFAQVISEISNAQTDARYLPVEVWEQILNHVSSVVDLKSLSLTSKLFHGLALKKLWSVTRLHCADGLNVIKDMPVEDLDMSQSMCDDTHLSMITCMDNLRRLNISNNASITDMGLSYLAALTKLEVLDIGCCHELTPESMSIIIPLPIQELNISGCGYTDGHLYVIGKMRTLKKLDMRSNPEVTDSGICYLKNLTQLLYLDISFCSNVTLTGLAAIEHLPIEEFYMCKDCSDLQMAVTNRFDNDRVLRWYVRVLNLFI